MQVISLFEALNLTVLNAEAPEFVPTIEPIVTHVAMESTVDVDGNLSAAFASLMDVVAEALAEMDEYGMSCELPDSDDIGFEEFMFSLSCYDEVVRRS